MAFFSANFMLQSPQEDNHHPLHSLNSILTSCTPQELHGVPSFVGKRTMPYSGINNCVATHEDEVLSDDGTQLGEKKRRLSIEQVKTLEKSFELGNKVDSERKVQLARTLGLQPRQVAIWFQNRRARWKTKQLEKDYDILKKHYESIKGYNEALQAQNQRLQAKIMALKNREAIESINFNKENEGCCSDISHVNSSGINLDISRTTPAIDSPISTHYSNSMSLFPTSIRSNEVAQLFLNSSRHDLQCPKVDQVVKEENFTNMFYNSDDQSRYWPYLEPLDHN